LGTSTPGTVRSKSSTLPKGKLQHHSLSRATEAAKQLSWSHFSPCHQLPTALPGWEREGALAQRARYPSRSDMSACLRMLLKSYCYHADGFAWSFVTSPSSTSSRCLPVTLAGFPSKSEQTTCSGLNGTQPCHGGLKIYAEKGTKSDLNTL